MSDRNIKTNMNNRLAFFIDTRYCANCKTCEVACKMERRLPEGQRWRKVRRFESGPASPSFLMDDNQHVGINVSISCNHCQKAKCVEVCPTSAYRKMPNGIVAQHNSMCIGCTKCVAACPYSAPVYNSHARSTGKCDMCYDRLQAGMEPFCVQCCPNDALKLGNYEALVAAYGPRQDISDFDGGTVIPAAGTSGTGNLSDTNPSIVIKVFD